MNEQKIPSVGDWIITLLLVSIPLVNIIALIYWAASSSIGSIKRNFAKAALIWFLIIIALYAIFFGAMIGSMLSFG
jgi:hypothetical protein